MLTGKKSFYVNTLFLVLLLIETVQVLAMDRRAYQHGVRLVKDQASNIWAVWSSSPGNPPQGHKRLMLADGTKCSYFTHDIFYSKLNTANLSIQPHLLLGMNEAQEPVDAAISQDGAIAVTFEDGSETDTNSCNGVIRQRYIIYPRFPERFLELKTVKVDGAHSGHVAAVGNNFVFVYAEGWIEGDGAFDAGTANDIYIETISSEGTYRWHYAVATDKGWPRDWWPLVAGSPRYALLAWQRLVKDSSYANLMIAVYDPQNNKLIKPAKILKENLQYYHFDVQYLEKIKRFLVVGNYLGNTMTSQAITVVSPKLFAYLLDETGNVVDYWESDDKCVECGNYPTLNLVREVRPAILGDDVATVLYPVKPNGIASLKVSKISITLKDVRYLKQPWFPLGTDGIFLDNSKALFINLTPTGARLIEVPTE